MRNNFVTLFQLPQNLILKNNTKSMEWWQDSPIQPLLKIHIFNYSNIDEVLNGKEKKIKVQDIGPYVYKEFGKRVNLSFTDDNKITFYVSVLNQASIVLYTFNGFF